VNLYDEIAAILQDILDIEGRDITPESYLIRELGAESIDLIELAVALNGRFGVEINDDDIFLKTLRMDMKEAHQQGVEAATFLAVRFPYLGRERLRGIVADIPGGPTLKVRDIVAYLNWQIEKNRGA